MKAARRRLMRLTYGGVSIPVQVHFIDTSRFSLTVAPDGSVRATAPSTACEADVAERLERRAGWIARQLAYFNGFRPERAAQRYVSGASLWYLGRQYRIKMSGGRGPAKLAGPFLLVPAGNEAECERKVKDWYREHARLQFAHRLSLCHAASRPILKIERPQLVVRKMIRRWGSCTAAGKVLLNVDLVRTPVHCIDYVIVHELCHIVVHAHDKAFYRLLSACMPDWERRKARLETFVL